MDEDFNPVIISKTNEQPDKYLGLVAVIISYLDDSTNQLPQIYAVEQSSAQFVDCALFISSPKAGRWFGGNNDNKSPAIERLTKIIVNTNNNINCHNSIQHIYVHIHFSDQQLSDQNQNDE